MSNRVFKKIPKLLVAGGGTGGHVLAGIAVADEWKKRVHAQFPNALESEFVLFVGSKQGLESKIVPKYGYPLRLLQIGALNKVGLKTRLFTLIRLPFSFLYAAFLVLKFRPNAVLGVGGYASGPVVMIARILAFLLPMKTAILEQNSVTGFTNRMLGHWVHRVFCAFDPKEVGSSSPFNFNKVLVTGNPIRSTLKRLPPSPNEPFTLFIFGGSQGAVGMNSMVLEALPFLKNQNIKFIHQTGVKDFERVRNGYEREGLLGPQVRIEKFIDNMAECYEQASLVICRAGASSMAELASVGRAAIFVPLPTAADNHQEINAKIFEKHNAAWVVRQGSLTGAQFSDLILKLKNEHQLIHEKEKNVQEFYRSDSAEVMVRDLQNGI